MSEVPALEGVVVDDPRTSLEQAMIECATEYDYAELPDHLRRALEAWAAEFRAWDRSEGYGATRSRPDIL